MATINGAFLEDDLDAIYGTPADEAVYDIDNGIFDVLGRYDTVEGADFDSPDAIDFDVLVDRLRDLKAG